MQVWAMLYGGQTVVHAARPLFHVADRSKGTAGRIQFAISAVAGAARTRL